MTLPSSRLALSLFLCPLLTAPFLLPARAAPVPLPLPGVCTAKLPLPSDLQFDLPGYEKKLAAFLQADCFRLLGWAHDATVRDVGPAIAQAAAGNQWVLTHYAVHGTAFVYYSPDVVRWMRDRDAAPSEKAKEAVKPVSDGSMIIKLMFNTAPAACFAGARPEQLPPAAMALMVKDAKGSRDGWFWGSFLPEPLLSDAAQMDWPPPVDFSFPWMGAGNYCVNCHASGIAEFTFSTMAHIEGSPEHFPTFMRSAIPPTIGATPPPSLCPRGFPLPVVAPAATVSGVAIQPAGAKASTPPPPAPVLTAAPLLENSHLEHQDPQHRLSHLKRADENPVKHHEAETARAKAPLPQTPIIPPYDPNASTRLRQPQIGYSPDFLANFLPPNEKPEDWSTIGALAMPPETYDHVVSGPTGPGHFLTSDQCVGCHAAGSTGMQFDMTAQPAAGGPLVNLSPYAEWRASPMGLAGRDPIFFAQLESERTFHPQHQEVIQDLCTHCHAVQGQRKLCMDQLKDPARCDNTGLYYPASERPADRKLFKRDLLNAVPYGAVTAEQKADSVYGALGRDGISCTTCHHVRLDDKTPFGETFTGDFRIGKADELIGPFDKPKQVPMKHALGITAQENDQVLSSKICGSCHSIVLPVFAADGRALKDNSLEQATYVEWALSDFRDGAQKAQSCQQCHMQSSYPGLATPLDFKIASIEEATDFPETENRLSRADIDLARRPGYARHTLVGLNVFFNQMAQQFPDILGIRVQDPMLVSKGIAPLFTTSDAMVDQAKNRTIALSITTAKVEGSQLIADVKIQNLAGHKFPSGVGFRRAFIEFNVVDENNNPLWTSGGTSPTGVLVDQNEKPIKGEFFWKSDCVPMTAAEQKDWYQPHYSEITRQDQVQIFQELSKDPQHKLTTSFLGIAERVKDNRLLPAGFDASVALAEKEKLGSTKMSAARVVEEVKPILPAAGGGMTKDGDFGPGGDVVRYRVPLADLQRTPGSVTATVYYQAIPPYYLQDRFCTAGRSPDTRRLFFLTGHLDVEKTPAEGWKLQV